jgi:hypothetical protein
VKFYKGARFDGWDWHTGKTINYRESIGKTVKCPDQTENAELCSSAVLHASRKPNDIFIGSRIPTAVFIVEGKPVVSDKEKSGFKALKVLEEIPQEKLDALFGWRYSEACNPVHPLKRQASSIGNAQIALLQNWVSVCDSVWVSVWASVWDSVWASVWDSVRDSVWASVWDSVRDSVWDSVRDSVRAYLGSLFPNIEKWKYAPKTQGYPYQSAVDLWKQGLVPSFDSKTWRLHAGADAKIVFEISSEKLRDWKE